VSEVVAASPSMEIVTDSSVFPSINATLVERTANRFVYMAIVTHIVADGDWV
jgi:hypothetical protein